MVKERLLTSVTLSDALFTFHRRRYLYMEPILFIFRTVFSVLFVEKAAQIFIA